MDPTMISMLLGKAHLAGRFSNVARYQSPLVQGTPLGYKVPAAASSTSKRAMHPPLRDTIFRLTWAEMPAVLRTHIDKCSAQDVMMLTRYTIQLRATPCTSTEFARHEFKATFNVGLQAHT